MTSTLSNIYAGDIARVLDGKDWSIGEVQYINATWKVGSHLLTDAVGRIEIVGNIFEY